MVAVTIASTHANTFVVVSGVSTPIAVTFKLNFTAPVPTNVHFRSSVREERAASSSFPKDLNQQFHVSSSATIPQWRRVARLARIRIEEDEILELCAQLNSIMSFVTQLEQAEVGGVEPMTSVTPMSMKMREDKVTDGGIADDILANAPALEDHFFLVPKVVE